MLSALNSKNEIITTFLFKDEEIQKNKKEKFSCPCCKEEVILKMGRKPLKSGRMRINHFSHLKDSDCPIPKESYEHISTKISIFNSLKEFGISEIWLERTMSLNNRKDILAYYLSEIQNNYSNLNIDNTFFGKLLKRNVFRPDICFKYNNENIAVEVQKSYLPKEDFLLRTLFYKILNIKVIWIIPDDIFTKKSFVQDNRTLMNISDFHKELKKYYFGNIYSWDYALSLLKVYKINKVTGYRNSGSMVDGEYGGQYFEESGEYEFDYKKLKELVCIHSQKNIIDKFKTGNIFKNKKYHISIDAKVWLLNL